MNSEVGSQKNSFSRAGYWGGPILIFAIALACFVWSWGLWPDPIIDFGRELYVPWRITQGDVLYGDIVSFNGPLSPYLIAFWFFCFGTSLVSLAIFNFVILLGVLLLLYVIFCRIGDKLSSTLLCLTFLTCFAFSQQIPTGNFNWITPYSHEVTHGIALSLFSFYLIYRFLLSGNPKWFWLAGFVSGLVFLTKAEVFLASFGGNVAGVMIFMLTDQTATMDKRKVTFFWGVAVLFPVIVSMLLFSLTLPVKQAFISTLGTWPHILNANHTNLLFFKKVMGTEDLTRSLFTLIKVFGYYLLLFVPSFALACSFKKRNWKSMTVALMLLLLVGSLLLVCLMLWGNFKWYYIPKPWQLLTFLILITLSSGIPKIKQNPKEVPVFALRYMMVLFSFLLLGKMFLNVRIAHYGFGLAFPAGMIVVVLLFSWIPAFIKRLGGQAFLFQAAVLAVWLVTVWVHLSVSNHQFAKKEYTVGAGKDLFKAGSKGKYLQKVLRLIEEKGAPGETLAVLPEGMMLNYQLRMPTSTRYVQYTPPIMTLYGEETIQANFQKNPPDWVVLIHRDDSEYGVQFFGVDYAVALNKWIRNNFTIEAQIGATPFRDRRFGVSVLRRIRF